MILTLIIFINDNFNFAMQIVLKSMNDLTKNMNDLTESMNDDLIESMNDLTESMNDLTKCQKTLIMKLDTISEHIGIDATDP